VYSRASLLLSVSEREGFGLPVAEALAAGTPVVATDMPVFREVGGVAASYARLGDTADWVHTVTALLREAAEQPDAWRQRKVIAKRRGSEFSWRRYACEMTEIYRSVADSASKGCATRHP
jgi:glycosyltransferase involved in cell wall biosynthesis